jgi:ankyrin repeat protein
VDALRALHALGADLAQPTGTDGATPAIIAAENGHAAVIACLSALKVDLDGAMAGGATACYVAACNGHGLVLEALAAGGAALDRANDNGATPVGPTLGATPGSTRKPLCRQLFATLHSLSNAMSGGAF